MPQIIMQRLWCKSCADWKLFDKNIGDEELKCYTCKTDHVNTLLSEIPEEKLLEQRKRYKEEKSRQFRETMGLMNMMGLNPRMSIPGISEIDRILESDAGQITIDKLREEQRKVARQTALDDIAAHKHLGRNDKCPCVENVTLNRKYKQCCLKRIQNYYR